MERVSVFTMCNAAVVAPKRID